MLFSFKNKILLSIVLGLSLSCSNSFEDFSDKSTDGYLIDSAKLAIDQFRFDEAIASLDRVIRNRPNDRTVLYLLSVSYAGRAGLRIIDLFDQIQDNISDKGVLLIFAQHFSAAEISDVEDLATAIRYIEAISDDATERTGDENFYTLFLYYAYIGGILNYTAIDSDSASKALRANFRACHTVVDFGGARTGITNTQTAQITITLSKILNLVDQVSVGDDLDSVLDTSDFPTGLSQNPVCETTPGDLTCLGVRSLVNVGGGAAGGIGLGTGEGVCGAVTP